MATRASTLERPARALRWGGSLLVALLAAASLQHLFAWKTGLHGLVRAAAEAGFPADALPNLRTRMQRENDLDQARLVLAEAMLGRELATREPDLVRGGERLTASRGLALDALARLPASSDALRILGAATSVLRSRARDPRLYSLSRDWERPLERAIELAPGDDAPQRLLAAAYVDVWPAVSPVKRAAITPMLRKAFLDPPTFERLFSTWVQVSGSLDEAASLLPDLPGSWRRLGETALARHDWRAYSGFIGHQRSAAAGALARLLEAQAGRPTLGSALIDLPVDGALVSSLEAALTALPAGPASDALARTAGAWISWARPLCLVRGCPLTPRAMARLGSLAGSALPPEDIALVALAADDPERAALLERRSDALWSEAWAPYLTYKALRLAARGESVEARLALRGAHRAFRTRLAWRRAAAALRLDVTHVEAPPDAVRWSPTEWWFDRGASRLDLMPARAGQGITLRFVEPARNEALVEPLWDGAAREPVVIAAGATGFRIPLAVNREPHLLELRVRAGQLQPLAEVVLE